MVWPQLQLQRIPTTPPCPKISGGHEFSKWGEIEKTISLESKIKIGVHSKNRDTRAPEENNASA